MQEFVVPKSIPITFAIITSPFLNLPLIKQIPYQINKTSFQGLELA
jgi:hypothetical protein